MLSKFLRTYRIPLKKFSGVRSKLYFDSTELFVNKFKLVGAKNSFLNIISVPDFTNSWYEYKDVRIEDIEHDKNSLYSCVDPSFLCITLADLKEGLITTESVCSFFDGPKSINSPNNE